MSAHPPPSSEVRSGRLLPSQRTLRFLALAAVLLAIVLAVLFRDKLPDPTTAAYPSLFIISFVSSASVFIPLPGIVAVCFGGTLLTPVLVGLVSGVAEALGETTGYLAGYGGRGIVEQGRWYRRIQPRVQRKAWIVLFIFSSIPNPLFDLVGLAAGAARVPLWQFYGSVWAGKTIKSTLVAYACSLGYDWFRVLSEASS